MARKSKAQIEQEALDRVDEINAAAEERVKAMMPGILAEQLTKTLLVAKANDGQAPTVSAQDTSWMQGLATAIVGAADPRNKNRTVDPAVMAARKEAHKRMIALLTEAHAKGEQAIYLVKVKMFLNNTKIDPEWRDSNKQFHATKIAWDRIPNQGMVPQNDLAKAIFAEFERSIGTVSAEGVPEAPWLNPGSPWVQTSEGIVLGRPVADVPEIAQAAAGTKIFNDPRVSGLPGEGRKETRVFGTIAPAVVEVAA